MSAQAQPRGYRVLVNNGHHRALILSGFVARLPMGMRALGLLVMVAATTDDYVVAGAASGSAIAAQALASPRWAHAVRHHGVARVIQWSLPVVVMLTGALVLAAREGASDAVLIVLAALSGCFVLPMGAISRGVWAGILQEGLRDSAYALEGVFDEIAYVAGPALVLFLEVALGPGFGVATASVLYALGAAMFAWTVRSYPSVRGTSRRDRRRISTWQVMSTPGVSSMVGSYVLIGAFFGALDVGIVARAEESGNSSAAGWLLSVLAVGSAASGLAYGLVRWRRSPRLRMLASSVLLAVLLLPLPFARDIPPTALWLAAAGFFVSPVLIAANGVVAEILPGDRAVVGLALLSSSITLGMGAGTSFGGLLVESFSPDVGIVAAVTFVLLSIAVQATAFTWPSVTKKASRNSSAQDVASTSRK